MVTPENMKAILCKHGVAEKYSFERPIPANAPLPIETFAAVSDFLGRGARNFKANYARRAKDLLHGRGYLTTIDDPKNHSSSQYLTKVLLHHDHGIPACRKIELYVRSLLYSKSFGLVGTSTRNIDIVKDVLNLAPIHWIAEEIGLPLKTGKRPRGVIFEQQADEAFKSIFQCGAFFFFFLRSVADGCKIHLHGERRRDDQPAGAHCEAARKDAAVLYTHAYE